MLLQQLRAGFGCSLRTNLNDRARPPPARQKPRRTGAAAECNCHAEWRFLNSSILTFALSFVSSTDWLTFSRLSAAFSEAASLCDSWICFAAFLASPQVSFTAPLACLTTPLLASFSLPTLFPTFCSTLPTA